MNQSLPITTPPKPSSSRFGRTPIPQTAPTHRISLMTRVSLGSSVAPCAVTSLTAPDKYQNWPCDYFWRFSQTFTCNSNLSQPLASQPLVSSVKQFIKSSYASFVRAVYDHMLFRDFTIESYKTSKDLPTIASFSK
uniref:Uncharacterized protein n=2 Tax=Arabidopsis thaliana TaxID=3702 RepID=Q1G389_ARATH|nr:unknown protein [Arabidopsis thaliana]